jgi:hypothetical protein
MAQYNVNLDEVYNIFCYIVGHLTTQTVFFSLCIRYECSLVRTNSIHT